MEKRRILLPLAFAAIALMSMANVLTPAQALQRLSADSHAPLRLPAEQPIEARPVLTVLGADNEAACYVMNQGNGYMVLSADDSAAPLLGYGITPIVDGEPLPPSLSYWLEAYSEQVTAVRRSQHKYQAPERPQFAKIAPLLTSKWNQDAPYNDDCPKINRVKCPTGCTATAMAQVLRYHQWPQSGEGEHSYTYQGATYSYDYANAHFDYSLMLDTYDANATVEQRAAVANLMYACGVAADMQYGPAASGAYLSSAVNGLIRNLCYSREAYADSRDRYTVADWETAIYNALVDCGPVMYSGYSQTYDGNPYEGHTFLVDGYAGDGYFHINWGWGGMGNGYFLLTALDTYGNGSDLTMDAFSSMQQAVFNLKPRSEAEANEQWVKISATGQMQISMAAAALGQEINWTATYANESDAEIDDVTFALSLASEDGSCVYVWDDDSHYQLPKHSQLRNCKSTGVLPNTLAAGRYRIGLAYHCSADDKVRDVSMQSASYLALVVRSDKSVGLERVEPTPTEPVLPIVSTPVLLTAIHSDQPFGANFTVAAPDDSEFTGSLTVMLLSDDTDPMSVVATAQHVTVSLWPAQSVRVEYVGTFRNVEPGAYYLAIGMMKPRTNWQQPMEYAVVSDMIDVEVTDIDTDVFDVEVSDLTFGAYKDNIDDQGGMLTVKFHAACTSGYGSPQFYLDFYDASNNELLGYEYTAALPFSAGTERNMTVTVNLTSLEIDHRYFCRMMIYDGTYVPVFNYLYFTIDEISTGVSDAMRDDAEIVDRSIYGLTGGILSETSSLAPGIYVEVTRYANGRTAARKIYIDSRHDNRQ